MDVKPCRVARIEAGPLGGRYHWRGFTTAGDGSFTAVDGVGSTLLDRGPNLPPVLVDGAEPVGDGPPVAAGSLVFVHRDESRGYRFIPPGS
jgi:hypothetical protein